MTLRVKAFSAVRWATIASAGRSVMLLMQISILARILEPGDFGLFAIIMSTIAMVGIFADAGVSNAIIHFQDITNDQLSTLYWLNIVISIILAIGLILFSPILASFYNMPELSSLFNMAAISLMLSAGAQQIKVLAQKELRFAGLAVVELLSTIIIVLASILLAFYEFGVYSLVLANLIGAASALVLSWVVLSDGWFPHVRFHIKEVRQFLRFGVYMIGDNLVNSINSQVDVIIGGRVLGSQAIGLYVVPKDLSLRVAGAINPIVTKVGMPIMAKAQADDKLIKRIYLNTLRMTSSVNFPLYVAMAIFAPEIVHVLLGDGWGDSIPLLRVMAAWGLLRSIGNPVGSLLMARGRADLGFRWNVALLFIMPPAAYLGSQFGAVGLALSSAIVMLILCIPSWYYLVRPQCGAQFGEYFSQVAVPLWISSLAGAMAYFAAGVFDTDYLRLLIGGLVGMLGYMALSMRFNVVWAKAMNELLFKRG